jgi:hypothetical protein
MFKLFDTFPREFGKKRVFVPDRKTFVTLINKYNGLIDCYTTIYSVPTHHAYSESVVDKIYFDLDSSQCWEDAKRLHNWLVENQNNVFHYINFSGGGVHVYIPIAPLTGNKKEKLRWVQENIIKTTKIKVDLHVIGDIARISRIPNTWNPKRQRYCIPLMEPDFDLSYDNLRKQAMSPRTYDGCLFGDKMLDVRITGHIPERYYTEPEDVPEVKATEECADLVNKLPQFIISLLVSCRCGWRDRYLTILAMREAGFPKSISIMIAKRYWTPEKFKHSVFEERQFDYLYTRDDLFFPNWELLEREGYCISKEDKKYSFYKKEVKIW